MSVVFCPLGVLSMEILSVVVLFIGVLSVRMSILGFCPLWVLSMGVLSMDILSV